MKYLFYLFIISISITACEVVDDPYPSNLDESVTGDSLVSVGDGTNADSLAALFDSLGLFADTEYKIEQGLNLGSTDSLRKFILNNRWEISEAPDNSNRRFMTLEEFTGHECIFCPLGTKEIIRLDSIYQEQLIPIAIHAGNFARPRSSGSKFTTDFRVSGGHGETYQRDFSVSGYPAGIVSRLSTQVTSSGVWETDINSIKADLPIAELKLKSFFSDSLKVLRAQIDIIPLVASSANYNLQVFLKEDNIIDWQKDAFSNPVDIEFYNHRHVLRKVVNDTYGFQLPAWQVGDTLSYQYVTTINSNWKVEDMEVVTFIFNRDPSSLEVIQANAAHFIGND
ncbi:MAG: Omp28-related outer membrane protein [Vicingaceae bacterium]